MVGVGQNCQIPWCLCRKVSRNKNILPHNINISPRNSEKVPHFLRRSAVSLPAGVTAALGRGRRLGRHGRISSVPGSRNGLPRRRMLPDCCTKTVSFCKNGGVSCQKRQFNVKNYHFFAEKITPPEKFLTLQARILPQSSSFRIGKVGERLSKRNLTNCDRGFSFYNKNKVTTNKRRI